MPATFLTDFSDRISPMLVKELRQGLRARTFIAVFLSLQVFLAVMLLSAGAASTSDHVGSVVSGIIFTFFSIAVLIVQPLRGTGALATEIKGNTIDMMVLTRLSSWRIVFGKWVAIVSQTGLLLATIIPYLILRYFFGGMNLVAELMLLLTLFLTSMALTAVTVGLSGCTSVIIRSLLPVLSLPILMWSLAILSFSRGSSDIMDVLSLDNTESRIGVAVYIAGISYIGISMLSLGASLIAPAAENHSIWRRLMALTAIVALFVSRIIWDFEEEWFVTIVTVIAVPALLIALTESSPMVLTVCKPFVKRGPIGRFIGWFLYPSWPSGILFSILLGVISVAAILSLTLRTLGGSSFGAEETTVLFSLFGSMLFPAVWQCVFFRGEGQRIANYLLILVGSFVMLGVLALLAESMNSKIFLWFFVWNPLAFLPMIDGAGMADSTLMTASIIVDAILVLVLFIKAITEIRKSSPVIAETMASLESTE